jgi:DNA methyltransferase 1-associated protein 1
MTRVDSPATSSAITKSSHQPVHLRSTRIPIPKANVAQKINAVLTEMAINSTRLVMPTKSNIEKMEALQNAAAGLVDIKKVVDRVDQEIRVLRARLGQEDEGGDEDAEGDVDADADADAEADMDAEGEHEVSVPIASTSAAQEKNLVRCRFRFWMQMLTRHLAA